MTGSTGKPLIWWGRLPNFLVTLGTNVPKVNNADMQSTGFELDLGWRDQIRGFNYGVHLLLSDDRQKILRYPNKTGKIDTWYAGEYSGNIWGFETIGIAKSQEEMERPSCIHCPMADRML